MIGTNGKTPPAPWVPYTRAGCNWGTVASAKGRVPRTPAQRLGDQHNRVCGVQTGSGAGQRHATMTRGCRHDHT
jgi:hypothetical protein